MKLFEFQAKNIFRDAGIHVPESALVKTKSEVKKALSVIG
ncbi:MAG: succinate--CoA ligase, partial [Spirochaetes bacterium]